MFLVFPRGLPTSKLIFSFSFRIISVVPSVGLIPAHPMRWLKKTCNWTRTLVYFLTCFCRRAQKENNSVSFIAYNAILKQRIPFFASRFCSVPIYLCIYKGSRVLYHIHKPSRQYNIYIYIYYSLDKCVVVELYLRPSRRRRESYI